MLALSLCTVGRHVLQTLPTVHIQPFIFQYYDIITLYSLCKFWNIDHFCVQPIFYYPLLLSNRWLEYIYLEVSSTH